MQDEGNSGPTAFTFTVTRTGDTSGTSSVTWTVSGTGDNAVSEDDFDFGASFPTGTVTFAAGETSKTITVNVNGDTDVEEDETFLVTLSAPSAGTTLKTGESSATGTIQNDDNSAVATKIFITSESGGTLYAWFDSNGNGTLEQTEIDDPNNGAVFGPGGNVNFATNSYIVEFIGISSYNGGGFPAINLNGFTDDDSIVVNFSQDWAGADLIGNIGSFQRGYISASYLGFAGYTHESYTQRVSSANMTKRYQSFNPTTAYTLKVGVTINKNSLSAGFQNVRSGSNVIPGGCFFSYQPLKIASWSASTTINVNQLSVVWPATLANLA